MRQKIGDFGGVMWYSLDIDDGPFLGFHLREDKFHDAVVERRLCTVRLLLGWQNDGAAGS